MNIKALEKNLTDNIKEAQIKLGCDARPMSLNYMLTSLNNILGTDMTAAEMGEILGSFDTENLGKITSRPIKDGFCLTISAEGTAYVNSLTEGYEFLTELISAIRGHGKSVEDIIAIFRRYSDNVTVENGNGEDFDYLVFFADGVPDPYLYCLTAEPCMEGGCHVIYHRFIRSDYESIFNQQ